MLKLAADENLDSNIVRGVLRILPTLDIVRVQDVQLSGADDPTVLEWCAHESRVLVTHDVSTVTDFAFERVAAGIAMPGIIQIKAQAPIGRAINDLILVITCVQPDELSSQVLYLPFPEGK